MLGQHQINFGQTSDKLWTNFAQTRDARWIHFLQVTHRKFSKDGSKIGLKSIQGGPRRVPNGALEGQNGVSEGPNQVPKSRSQREF